MPILFSKGIIYNCNRYDIETFSRIVLLQPLTYSRKISQTMILLSISDKSLQPYLEQIDQIEESVATLEQAAYSLDQYSKRLGESFLYLSFSCLFTRVLPIFVLFPFFFFGASAAVNDLMWFRSIFNSMISVCSGGILRCGVLCDD